MCVYNNSVKTFGIRNISCVEPGETRYADGVLNGNHLATSNGENDKNILTASTMCCFFFVFDKFTASGRMSGQHVYNWSFRGILNTKFSQ